LLRNLSSTLLTESLFISAIETFLEAREIRLLASRMSSGYI
jgi:hypothetical protein